MTKDIDLTGFAAFQNDLDALFGLEEPTWIVGTIVEYAINVEFGTSRQQAQPYLRPALNKVEANIDSIWEDSSDLDEFVAKTAFSVERLAKELAPVDTGNLQGSITASPISDFEDDAAGNLKFPSTAVKKNIF